MAELNLFPNRSNQVVSVAGKEVKLTNVDKIFFPSLRLTKGDLLHYYAQVSPLLLPHVKTRAMVMKRYPHGITGNYFFMKRTPSPAPEWLRTCQIEHASGNIIDFPVIDDLASLLWVINLGCIDLNPWYSRCDDVNRPDYLHFDLDPVPPAGFERVSEAALVVEEALVSLRMNVYAKTSGSDGIHLYVPIKRGPLQKEVWGVAKHIAIELARKHADLLTAEYRIAQRPKGRVLVDYNQNAWGRTLASVYSVRPKPTASVSTPVTMAEIRRGITPSMFTMLNARERFAKLGDLWHPLELQKGRYDLGKLKSLLSSKAKP